MAEATGECVQALLAAKARWPGLSLDADAFRSASERAAPLPAHAVDFALACACLAGDAIAQAAFEAEVLAQVMPIARRMLQSDADCQELLQLTRLRLLVGDGCPRLAEYHGKGSLAGWVKTVATRLGLNELKHLQRAQAHEQAMGELPELGLEHDPTLVVLRERHRTDFQAALREGFSQLTGQQRTLLQMSLLDGLSIDRIGAANGVHRATAARWLEQARLDLIALTRSALAQRLALSPTELESLLRDLGSQVDLSLGGLLRSA
jgi:RNA polymerase sigma-70 factor (ECF subfamily)